MVFMVRKGAKAQSFLTPRAALCVFASLRTMNILFQVKKIGRF